MANTQNLFRNGAIGFIDWLDAALQTRKNDSQHRHHGGCRQNTKDKVECEIWHVGRIHAESWREKGVAMVSSLEYPKHRVIKPELIDRNQEKKKLQMPWE